MQGVRPVVLAHDLSGVALLNHDAAQTVDGGRQAVRVVSPVMRWRGAIAVAVGAKPADPPQTAADPKPMKLRAIVRLACSSGSSDGS